MSRLAAAATRLGWAAWNVEYRRLGPLGGGGGWPATFEDIAAALDHLGGLAPRGLDTGRVVTCGHSAGGHLALWVAARTRTPGLSGPRRVRPVAAVSLAGAVDLGYAARQGLGAGAPERLLGGPPAELPERYRAASPAELLPLGLPHLLVQGLRDDVVPPAMAEEYCRRARAAGDEVRLALLEEVDHMDVIDPTSRAWQEVAMYLGSVPPT